MHIFEEWGASQVALVVKNAPASARGGRRGFNPWVGNMPWEEDMATHSVFLPGESHGQSSLESCKESDMTEAT